MNHSKIRLRVIMALFSNPELCDRFVVKGGNALALVYKLIDRASFDVDVSLDGDFEDFDRARSQLNDALTMEFAADGLVVFDYSLEAVPPALSEDRKSWWGGYLLKFKVIDSEIFQEFRSDEAALRRRALTVDGVQGRTLRVEISRGEWCTGKVQHELEGRTIYVYSEEMCIVEKFRALCQKLPTHAAKMQSNPSPRARDLFDIYIVVTRRGLELTLPENIELFRLIFGAKQVPLELLRDLRASRAFQESDWPSVVTTVPARLEPFDRYFDFTVDLAELVADKLLG